MRKRTAGLIGLILMTALLPAVWAQSRAPKTVRRAQPPKFSGDKTFYADAFKEGLVGERPANLGQPAATAVAGPTGSTPAAGSGAGTAPSGSGWSNMISATTIEDEIKTLKTLVDEDVTTPSDFAGKGYKVARRDFSMLAMLFAIVAEYDGDIRFKSNAAPARDVFARTAANAKVGTVQVFQEAKLRKQELQDLISGASPFAGKTAETKPVWPNVCNRSPLMQHLENVWEPRMKPALSDKGQFAAESAKLLHDAEIFAAIGEVLAKDGMEDADSDEYKAFSHRLRDAAKEIADAVKSKNYEQASKAAAEISKSCLECHENYRA